MRLVLLLPQHVILSIYSADGSVTIGEATIVIPESEATMMFTTQATGSVPAGAPPPEATGGTTLPDTNFPSGPTPGGTGPATLQYGSGGIADSGPGATSGSPSQSAVDGSVSAGGSAINGGTAGSPSSVASGSRAAGSTNLSSSSAAPAASSSPAVGGNSDAERIAGGVGMIVAGVVGAMLL